MVLIWRAMNERSAYRFGQPIVPPGGGLVNVAGAGTGSLLWCMPFGAQTPASWEALAAQHYMATFGVTNADLGPVSVAQRRHAATNPAAWFYERPITLEDHQQSRWIVEPVLRLLDCCQESDGGVALVVTSIERARDLRQAPVRIVAAAQSIPAEVEVISNYYHADLTVMPEAMGTARRLYRRVGSHARGHAGRDALRCLHHAGAAAARGVRLLRARRGEGFRRATATSSSAGVCR